MDAGADLELGVRLGLGETPLSFPGCEADFERVVGVDVRGIYIQETTLFFWRDAPASTRTTHPLVAY